MTTGADLTVVAFSALSDDEQAEAFARIRELHLAKTASAESEAARLVRAVLRVSETLAGAVPTADEYRRVRTELLKDGDDLPPLSQVVRFFGTWAGAREAAELAADQTPRAIEARFAKRRVGKVWRYTTETLRDTLAACVEDVGRPPLVAEFDWWRQKKIELAHAEGRDAYHLPSAAAYRRRFRTWEAALLHFGYTPDRVAERLEPSGVRE